MNVSFSLGAGTSLQGTPGSWGTSVLIAPTGQVNVSGTNGATFYITGVQLEVGTVATSFDYRSYGTELALCQRYLPVALATSSGAYVCMGYAQSSTQANLLYQFKVTPRVPPTGVSVNSASSFGATTQASGGTGSSVSFTNASLDACNFALNVPAASYTTGSPLFMYALNSTGVLQFTGCEL